MQNLRALVIEDDKQATVIISEQLKDLGLTPQCVSDGREGLETALSTNFDIVICDLGLPSLGGMEICRRLREAKPALPILILTGEQDELKTVLALELGADEYVRKPFSSAELRARIRALLRRATNQANSLNKESQPTLDSPDKLSEELVFDELRIDLPRCEVYIGQTAALLTPTEFDLLVILAKSPERVFSRDELVQLLWQDSPDLYSQNIRFHVSKLRSKLTEAGATRDFVVTARGFGYRFCSTAQD